VPVVVAHRHEEVHVGDEAIGDHEGGKAGVVPRVVVRVVRVLEEVGLTPERLRTERFQEVVAHVIAHLNEGRAALVRRSTVHFNSQRFPIQKEPSEA
jgi:hypothetical protein